LARSLFEREATPATELATQHLDRAENALLASASIQLPSILGLTDFRRLCLRLETMVCAKYKYLQVERSSWFLKQLLHDAMSGSDHEILRQQILSCAIETGFAPRDLHSIKPILNFLRRQDTLTYVGHGKYRLSSTGEAIALSMNEF